MNTPKVAAALERFWIWLSWRLPRSLAYWTYIRVAVEGNKSYPADQKVIEPAKRWREAS